MSTRTTTSKGSTINNRGRGGRGRGRGANGFGRDTRNEETDAAHPHGKRSNQFQYQGNSHQSNRGRGSFQQLNRGRGNIQQSNRGRESFQHGSSGNFGGINNIVGSDDPGRHLSPNQSSNRIPRHVQNPFFVGELMSRFSSMVTTPSFIENDTAEVQQPNGNPAPHITLNAGDSLPNVINKNNVFCHKNENSGNSENKNLEGLRNRSKKEHYVKRLQDQEPQFRHQNTAAFSSGADNNEGKIMKTTSFFNLPLNGLSSFTDNKKHNKNESLNQEINREISQAKSPSTSNNNNNKSVSPGTVLKKISLEERKVIMKSYGFDIEEKQNCDNNQNKEKELNQTSKNRGVIADRTSPRVRYNLQVESRQSTSNSTIPEGNGIYKSDSKPEYQPTKNALSLHMLLHINNGAPVQKTKDQPKNSSQLSVISGAFLSQLDTMENSISCLDSVRPGSSSSMRVYKNNGLETNGNRPPGDASKFNPFLKSEKKNTPKNNMEENNLSNQRRQRREHNSNPAIAQSTPNLQRPVERITNSDFSGSSQLAVHRPLRDQNDRVPSRAEALDRIQEQYEIQRAISEAKKREKEAKKRQEYLSKYKHVDQGYRLNDGLLDEAAGYAPGYNLTETVEEVRERQQEQMRLDALKFQQQQREAQEKQKELEEKKNRGKFEKYKHVDAGFRLGQGDNTAPGYNLTETVEEIRQRQQEQMRLEALKFQQQKQAQETRKKSEEKKNRGKYEKYKNVDVGYRLGQGDNRPTDPGFLLEGETEEEALQRQEEQLILELLIQEQAKLQAQTKQDNEKEEKFKKFKNNHAAIPSNSNSMNPFLSAGKSLENLKSNSVQDSPKQPHESEISSGAVPKYSKNNEQTNGEARGLVKNNQTVDSNHKVEETGAKRQTTEVELKKVPIVSQASSSNQTLPETPGVLQNTASCILKNKSGAVLVLRRSSADLNRALANRVEVQDEVDKRGYSPLYTPTVEPAPQYSHNRFERRQGFDVGAATGAIPKNTNNLTFKPLFPASAQTAANIEPPKQGEAMIDHRAELIAARFRAEQQHDERLIKEQAQQFSNSRFERKQGFDVGAATGAIPKNTTNPTFKPSLQAKAQTAANSETPGQDEPKIDYKAELIAARMRFQQQYEESLKKKKQEQNNDS